MMQVILNNESFPLREIEFSFGKRLISIEALNDKILNQETDYVSEEARYIDEQIFYFVEAAAFDLPEDVLVEKILAGL